MFLISYTYIALQPSPQDYKMLLLVGPLRCQISRWLLLGNAKDMVLYTDMKHSSMLWIPLLEH